MTYIQSHNSNLPFRIIIFFLVSTVVLAAMYLIIIYSHTVSLANEIQDKRLSFKTVMMESAELQSQIFQQVTDSFLRTKAAELGLVEEKNPIYFETEKQWLFASQ